MAKFKAGDWVMRKSDGVFDRVKSAPGMKEYDEHFFIDSNEGFILENNSWERQESWELDPTQRLLATTISSGTSSLAAIQNLYNSLNLNVMASTYTPIHYAGGSGSAYPLSVGDSVVLIGTQYASSSMNPIWGHDGQYVKGLVERTGPSGCAVKWDNGSENAYRYSELAPYSSVAKKKERAKKPIELDTAKLDSLIIKPDYKYEIIALLQQHKHAKKIFEEWGLGETIEYGRGMSFLFWGPPGTGKTWGANCIARALGKELLIISAAEIQSSEPGGANRAIQEAFRNATEQNKVLFLDECDSLIANRNNLGMILSSEINTLLTEIERFEGVCILATNRVQDMDAALERRIQLIIEFAMPTEDERVEIWKKLIPKKMPLNDDVKIEELAKHVFSGGIIKNIVLGGARLAVAAESKDVKMEHFSRAVDRAKKSSGLMGKKRVQSDGMDTGTSTSKDIVRKIDNAFTSTPK